MKTLILGGSTFVGRRLVDLLVREGHEVTVLNRGRTTSDLPAGVQRIVGDRTSTESMTAALAGTQWDAVIDVSGFVMAAGGGEFDDLIRLLDGTVGAYVFVSSIMGFISYAAATRTRCVALLRCHATHRSLSIAP